MAKDCLNWVQTTGGPLMILPKALLRYWSGIEPTNDPLNDARFRWDKGAPGPSDYDRACDVGDAIAVLEVGTGQGIVFGGEPNFGTWWPVDDGGYVVRWVFAECEADIARNVPKIPARAFRSDRLTFRFAEGPLILFDSADAGVWFKRGHKPRPKWQETDLPPGEYRLSTATYEPDKQTCILAHRLMPTRSGTTTSTT